MTVYNGLLAVDRFDADGIGISALPVYDSGTPPSKKITFWLGHDGHTQHSQPLSSPSAAVLPRPAPRPQLWSLEVRGYPTGVQTGSSFSAPSQGTRTSAMAVVAAETTISGPSRVSKTCS